MLTLIKITPINSCSSKDYLTAVVVVVVAVCHIPSRMAKRQPVNEDISCHYKKTKENTIRNGVPLVSRSTF